MSAASTGAGDGREPDAELDPPSVTEFGPQEPTDGRGERDWKSRYSEKSARRQIRAEALYLLVMMLLIAAAMVALALRFPRPSVGLTSKRWDELAPFGFALAGGAAGGTLFSAKWLYHTVARGWWNADRWIWRVFTPFMSAGGALTVVTLSAGHVLPVFGSDLVRTDSGALGVSLLVGYFTERTFSWLERMAEQHFGTSKRRPDGSTEASSRDDPEG